MNEKEEEKELSEIRKALAEAKISFGDVDMTKKVEKLIERKPSVLKMFAPIGLLDVLKDEFDEEENNK